MYTKTKLHHILDVESHRSLSTKSLSHIFAHNFFQFSKFTFNLVQRAYFRVFTLSVKMTEVQNQSITPSAPLPETPEAFSDLPKTFLRKTSLGSNSATEPSAPLAVADELLFTAPISQVELTISASSLLNLDQFTRSDPICVIYLQDSSTSGEWIELGRTETIFNNLNPEWKRKFLVDYRFEERQMLTFMVYDKDCTKYSLDTHDFLGKLECSMGEIISAPHSKFERALKLPLTHDDGQASSKITIVSEEIGDCKKELSFQLTKSGKSQTSSRRLSLTSRPLQKQFVTISKKIGDRSWILLHRTDRISVTERDFPTVNIRYSSVCKSGDLEAPLRFQLHYSKQSIRGKTSQLIGENITNFIELSENCKTKGSTTLSLVEERGNASEATTPVCQLEITNFGIRTHKTFMDYLKDGLQLNLAVAIDFTASNGEPTRISSLHYKHGLRDNPYVTTLKILGEIFQDYCPSKQFHAYGFGAKGYPLKTRVNHKFSLNFKELNPVCQGIDGVLTAYYRTLQRVKLFGPTCFAPIIREVTNIANSKKSNSTEETYFVLLILTDGIVCDPETTVDALVEASNAPLSVIIIGIGDEDFTAMEKLDSDEKFLKSRSDRRASRDIVQFVDLKKYVNFKSVIPISEGEKKALTRSVLAELPHQVVAWMNLKREDKLM